MLVRNDHDVPGVVRVEVHDDKCMLTSPENQRIRVVIGGEVAAEHAVRTLRVSAYVFHAPRRPETLRT
jgi:hypothetical protein